MFVTPDVEAAVTPPWPETFEGERQESFRATLDAFTRGDWLPVAEDPKNKPPNTTLARVRPVEKNFWAIRETEKAAGIRCIGAFAEKDVFIGIDWSFRDGMDWDAEVTACMEIWSDLFEEEPPFHGKDLHDYLSNFFPV